MGPWPDAAEADTQIVPAPALEKACEGLGPESLDLWVLLAEAKTPEDREDLTGRLDRRDIEWRRSGDDVCVRRRDRVAALERLGIDIGRDGYVGTFSIRARTDEPRRCVEVLSQCLKEEGLTGFVETYEDEHGIYDPILFVRCAGAHVRRFPDLMERSVSKLRELAADAEGKLLWCWDRFL